MVSTFFLTTDFGFHYYYCNGVMNCVNVIMCQHKWWITAMHHIYQGGEKQSEKNIIIRLLLLCVNINGGSLQCTIYIRVARNSLKNIM